MAAFPNLDRPQGRSGNIPGWLRTTDPAGSSRDCCDRYHVTGKDAGWRINPASATRAGQCRESKRRRLLATSGVSGRQIVDAPLQHRQRAHP
jgi:hypothetical protein